jgi:DNA-binding IclR family transcriptional regulator
VKLNQSVQRAAAILRAASQREDGETASGLARAAGLPWTTTVRLIRTLEEEGFLTRIGGGKRYAVGLDLIRLARARDDADVIAPLARPLLEKLAAEVEETVNLTLVGPDGKLDVVEQVDPDRILVTATWTGRPYPLHASSIGKLLLAGYDDAALEEVLSRPLPRLASGTLTDPDRLREEVARIRATGVSETVDELEDGLATISVGVADGRRGLAAMVSVSGPSSRFDSSARAAALDPLQRAVVAIEKRLDPRRTGLTAPVP